MRIGLPFVVLFACGQMAIEPDEGIAAPEAGLPCPLRSTQRLVSAAGGNFGDFAFIKDLIVFTDGSTLTVAPRDGGAMTGVLPCSVFALDGDVVFCTDGSTLWRVPFDGTSPTQLGIDLSLTQNGWPSIAAGEGHVYISNSHNVISVDEVTGVREPIAAAPAIWIDAFDHGTLYWRSNSGGVASPNVAFNATSVAANSTTTLATVSLETRRMKLTATAIYFMGYDPHAPVDPVKLAFGLYALPREGGDAQRIIEDLYDNDFALDDAMIIVARRQNGNVELDLAGQEIGKPMSNETMTFARFDGPYVYWVTDDFDHGSWLARACR